MLQSLTSSAPPALIGAISQILGDRTKRNRYAAGAVGIAVVLVGYYATSKRTQRPSKILEEEPLDAKKKKRTILDKDFLAKVKPLLKIVLPGLKSKEFLLLCLHTAFLVSRTFLSIYVATLDGAIVKSLVDRNLRKFIFMLVKWLLVAVPATYVNSMIKYLESKLFIAFRTRLTEHSYKLYMTSETYYRVGNLDSRLNNADQCLTEDVSKFCEMLAHLHSQISKPLLDVVLMSWSLYRMANEKGSGSGAISGIVAFFVIYMTAKVLKYMQPPFGKLAAQQAQYEGDLRFVQSRLITNSEEVAFYRGHRVEEKVLMSTYMQLIKHTNVIFGARIFYNMLEGFFMKYVWSAAGLSMIAIPIFLFEKRENNVTSDVMSTRAKDYTTSKMLLISGAEAIERIMLAFKDVNELAGYTDRVSEMLEVFRDVQKGRYQKTLVNTTKTIDMSKRGVLVDSTDITFSNVPIVSPNGDVLVSSLSFEVKPGMHLLISGPNGCGKSSLFRILGGLWPVFDGTVSKPPVNELFYIPQRPYLSLGNFRDQIIYPDEIGDMNEKGQNDKDLEEILKWVSLQHILEREGGWDSTKNWKDVLSGGEKQRVGMARLLYHKPRYAILDECTSAVSIDVEGQMYQRAIDVGITLLTVTHRPTLWKYHNYLLQFNGEGGWKFSQLNATARLSLKEEKEKLETQLNGVPKMQKRLNELCQLLGEDSINRSTSDDEAQPDEVQTQE